MSKGVKVVLFVVACVVVCTVGYFAGTKFGAYLAERDAISTEMSTQ